MTGLFVPWLSDAARLTGYPVIESTGWRTRGVPDSKGQPRGMRVVEGITPHHTAGPATGDYPSLRVVRDGRAGLQGPLSHYGLGRSGTVHVIAAGLCYHAGASSWAGFTDLNDEFLGIEAEDDGDGTWTSEQLDAYPRLVAACLYYMRRDASRAAGHREICLPKGRKIDPAGIDLDAFRGRVAWLLADPLNRIPRFANPPPTPDARPEVDDDMPIGLHFYNDDWLPDGDGLNFRGAAPAEWGDNSLVVARAFVRWVSYWGGARWKVVAWNADGPIGEANPNLDNWELPRGARGFTVEGRREHVGVIPAASLLQQAK
jgi:hypothetical protein